MVLGLVQFDDVVGQMPAGGVRHEIAIDDRPDQNDGHGLRLETHQIFDLEAALDADALVGADDLLDGIAAAERQQQPLIRHVLVVGVLHRRNRIGRPLVLKANAIQGNHAGISFRPERVVEIAIGRFSRLEVVAAIGGA